VEVTNMLTTRVKPICSHCGSNLIIADDDGQPYCLMCRRPYHDFRDYGRMGGLQTLMRYGREHMVKLGKRGGRPRLRQLPAPETETKIREGMAARPNSLKVLKELVKNKYGSGLLGE